MKRRQRDGKHDESGPRLVCLMDRFANLSFAPAAATEQIRTRQQTKIGASRKSDTSETTCPAGVGLGERKPSSRRANAM
jgi:hypothetical protein